MVEGVGFLDLGSKPLETILQPVSKLPVQGRQICSESCGGGEAQVMSPNTYTFVI